MSKAWSVNVTYVKQDAISVIMGVSIDISPSFL